MIQSFRKHIKHVLKNVGTVYKVTEWNGNFWKELLASGTRSYYQERVLSRELILNQECVLNHIELIKRFFWFDHLNLLPRPSPHCKLATPPPPASPELQTTRDSTACSIVYKYCTRPITRHLYSGICKDPLNTKC